MSTTLSPSVDVVPQPPVYAITGNAWDRMPDEPTRHYDKFDTYRAIGPTRSLLAAYNLYRSQGGVIPHGNGGVSRSWYDAFKTYNWKARAVAYDDHQRNVMRINEEQAKLESRQFRITVLTDLLTHAHNALPEIDWGKSTGSQLSHAIKTATAELRIDHHDVPATQHNVDVRAILAVLPVELRAVVAQTLKKSGD